jgi:hypothetical protein
MSEKDENIGSFYVGRTRVAPEPKRVLPRGMLTTVTVLAFAGLVWYAYPQGQEKYTDVDVPVITADTAPYKSKPADPGGMDVPHRDSTVFESLNKGAPAKPEKVTSKQEEPLDRTKLGLGVHKAQLNLEAETPPQQAKPEPAKQEAAKQEPPKPQAEKKDATAAKQQAPAAPAHDEPQVKPAAGGDTHHAPSAAPVAAKPAAYIQLGAYKTEVEAMADVIRLRGKYAELKGLPMRAPKADLGPKGVFYRLQAGLPSVDKAKDVCVALKSAGASCMVVK